MRYAISYVSTAHLDLKTQGVKNIMNQANEFNTNKKINGILLYNERSFFQFLEGEKEVVQNLYEEIKQDTRHHDIIQFLEMPVSEAASNGYLTDFITDINKHDKAQLKKYLNHIKALNPESQQALKKVIELMRV